ncbi:hypothetical protein [Phreatobacter sp.]|uniref:hypothetical protein n=1 Tax=Phreatobacter sp. TaxID=1966341 RepID=UPI0022C832A2|nr:hypothetical protein [Phreatobacter sp.]MCZ8315141.1 hypothetical protein [Phreatobacter sp.]
MAPAPPLPIANRWTGLSNSLRVRCARSVNRAETARALEALLREIGPPLAYDVFDRSFDLGEPGTPGAPSYPDITIVIGDAEHDLFFVAQRERGALGRVSVHESIHDAADDFMRRATDAVGPWSSARIVVFGSPP